MKKGIITLLLASFMMTQITPVACFAVGDKNEAKKVSISKSHKQRAKNDSFKYEYINYKWWDNFNRRILTKIYQGKNQSCNKLTAYISSDFIISAF